MTTMAYTRGNAVRFTRLGFGELILGCHRRLGLYLIVMSAVALITGEVLTLARAAFWLQRQYPATRR